MAYVHFRWENEDGVPILYCYEIQLEADVQRKGLGRCEPAPITELSIILYGFFHNAPH